MGWMGGVAALDEKVMVERARPIRWMGCHSRRIGAQESLVGGRRRFWPMAVR
jgi:hypothetical protein